MFTPQNRSLIIEAATSAYNEVLSLKTKALDARKIVPFLKKGDDWTSILKYWVSRGNTELKIKSKTDTEGNNINLQMKAIADELTRFPIDLELPLIVFKEYENNKNGLINYFKEHINEALKAYGIFTNEFCLIGKKEHNITGLVNDSDIDTFNFNTGLNTITGKELFNQTNMFLQKMVNNSSKAFVPEQLAVSTNFYTQLVSKTVGSNEITVLDKLLKENPYLRSSSIAESDRIIQLGELDSAGVGSKDRIIALADDENGTNYHFEETMRMHVYAEGFDDKKYYKNWENRAGGLMINQLKSITYGDIAIS